MPELGYRGYETFGSVLEQYAQKPSGFGAVLERYGIPLAAAYCPTSFYDPAEAAKDVEQATRWARLARGLGATTIVLQAGRRHPEPYAEYEGMAEVFIEIGRRIQDMDLMAASIPIRALSSRHAPRSTPFWTPWTQTWLALRLIPAR